MSKLRFAALIRVSTEKQADKGESLRTQEKQIDEAVAIVGGEVTRRYAGQEHATPDAERQILDAFLADAQRPNPPFDAVMVADESRWSRDNAASKRGLAILREAGIRFFVRTMEHKLNNATARLWLGMSAEIGEYQASVQNEKSILNRVERAKRLGAPTCGKLPFGRTWDAETATWGLDPAAVALVRDVANRYLAGEPMPRLAAEYGVNHSNLHKVLTQRSGPVWEQRFRCKAAEVDETVVTEVPRLLDDEIIRAICLRAETNRTFTRGKRVHPYLLGGMVYCAACGYTMNGQTNHNGHRYYRHGTRAGAAGCTLSPRPWVRAEDLESAVVTHLFETFGNPRALERAIEKATPNLDKLRELRAQSTRLEKELKRIERGREQLMDFVVSGKIKRSQADKKFDELNERERALQAEAERINEQVGNQPTADAIRAVAEHVAAAFEGTSTMRRRPEIHDANTDITKLSWDDSRALVEMVFAGNTPEGTPNGVYVGTIDGQAAHRKKQFEFTLRGKVVDKQECVTKPAQGSPNTAPPARRFSAPPPRPRP